MDIKRPAPKQPIPSHAKKVFTGVISDIYQWEQELFDGTKTTFEKVKRLDSVVVFPILPDGKILLTKQEQPGKAPFIAATGGRVEDGEDILAAAKRELLEESGYEAEEYILWDSQQPTGVVDWAVYTFIAKGLKKVADLHLDAGEKIQLHPVTLDELITIATTDYEHFYEKQVAIKLFEAKLNPEKMSEVRNLFKAL